MLLWLGRVMQLLLLRPWPIIRLPLRKPLCLMPLISLPLLLRIPLCLMLRSLLLLRMPLCLMLWSLLIRLLLARLRLVLGLNARGGLRRLWSLPLRLITLLLARLRPALGQRGGRRLRRRWTPASVPAVRFDELPGELVRLVLLLLRPF